MSISNAKFFGGGNSDVHPDFRSAASRLLGAWICAESLPLIFARFCGAEHFFSI
jgi:hypothetical protein